ncbi:hypothetical protein ACFU7Y_06310 [Kitasatospora sp. NPDC057542]|uniref:hypothetical protein n=1 Tax=Kitasatospora sp. NPDC057542 TaxID=3346162 RepID=UPI0036890A93
MALPLPTTSGVVGRPSLGTPAKGNAVLRALTSGFVETLRVLTGEDTAGPDGEPDD